MQHDPKRAYTTLQKYTPLSLCMALAFAGGASAQSKNESKDLGVVVITSGQASSLPTQIPTTLETVTATQIAETLNAIDAQDALKYMPSLSVRKRYIGDYNHAVLASRASGANNPARSAVYADGILLSNHLGNAATNAPRWGLVTPEEIERVDVMYGPFSAAYPGNSVGAVVDFVTRMPTQFETHMKVSAFNQHFDIYNTDAHLGGANTSAAIGSKAGDWSYWVNLHRLDSSGQPMVFMRASPTRGTAGTPVQGVVAATGSKNEAADIVGTTTQYHTVQDHAKLKLAYDHSPTVRAMYTLGYWHNHSDGSPATYLSDARTGAPVWTGTVNNGVNQYTLPAFTASQDLQMHRLQGLSLKSHTQGVFDWEVATSAYDYITDQTRTSGTISSATSYASAGKLTDQAGTGWRNWALKGTWRPEGLARSHVIDMGYQHDHYTLQTLTHNTANGELNAAPASLASQGGGHTRMQSAYVQDAWKFAPRWKTVLGVRAERWQASGGFAATAATSTNYASREETHFSPKAAVSHQWAPDLLLKVSMGRALRMPTVQELYGSTNVSNNTFLNDPSLRPERSLSHEWTVEKDLGNALLRITGFMENTQDAIYAQSNVFANGTTQTFVQNIQRMHSKGLEMAYAGQDVVTRGLEVSGSVTYVQSLIKENAGSVAVAGDTLGKYQPRVPVWRGQVWLNHHWDDRLSTALGARYSGRQFATLNNADVNGNAYTGVSRFWVVDARVVRKVDRHWTVAAGVDNLNNHKYWNYHIYPMRTFFGELKYDLQ